MLTLGSATHIFVATAPVDLRGSFNRLSSLVEKVLAQDPLSGHWFCFTNRRRNRVKILVWDGSGLWVLAKRIEAGRLNWPKVQDASANLRPEELSALLSGLEITAKSGLRIPTNSDSDSNPYRTGVPILVGQFFGAERRCA